ncbi:MAG TPA: hypothetical protein VGA35_01660, partial [bacterium]
GYLLENLVNPTLPVIIQKLLVITRWVQAISREGQTNCLEPSETVRRILTAGEAKIQSELLGD